MTDQRTNRSGNGIGTGAALGLLFGLIYGNKTGNISQSMALGISLGVAIGVIFDFVKSRSLKHSKNEPIPKTPKIPYSTVVPGTFKNGKYDSCFLKTTDILAINDGFISNSVKLSFIISDEQNINEKWTLTADGVCNYNNLFSLSYMPYFTMDLEENHPLLWRYQQDLINCQLKGLDILNDKQKNELIGELANYYSKEAGGFFESHPILNPIRDSNGNLILETNQKVFDIIEPLLRKHEITIENYKVVSSNQKGPSNNQNLKVLLIRNPFVTSVNAIREQTFIIANELKFEKNSSV